jgi:hypothetical protein
MTARLSTVSMTSTMAMTATVLIAPARQKAGSSKWMPATFLSMREPSMNRSGAIVYREFGDCL